MVGTPPRPRLVVLPCLGICIGARSIRLVLKMNVPVPSVRVHARVHDDNGALQQFGVSRGEGFDSRHGSFRAHRFISMHVVAQIHPNHAIPTVHPLIDSSRVVGFEFLDSGHVFRRRHDQTEQGTSLGRLAIFHQLPMRHSGCHVLQIVHHEMMSCERFAEVMANDCRGRCLGKACGEPKQDEKAGQGASTTHEKWSIHVANIEKSMGAVMSA